MYLLISCGANCFSSAFLDLLLSSFVGSSFFILYKWTGMTNYILFLLMLYFFRHGVTKVTCFYKFSVTPPFAPPRGRKILSLFEDDIFCSDPLLSLISGGNSFLNCVIDSL